MDDHDWEVPPTRADSSAARLRGRQRSRAAQHPPPMGARRRLGVLCRHTTRRALAPSLTPSSAAADAAKEPTVGLLASSPDVCPGLTLFSKGRSTLLIDNDGQLVHEWKSNREGGVPYLQRDGTLMRFGTAPRWNGKGEPRDETYWNDKHWSYAGGEGYIQAIAWDSTLLWEYAYVNHEHMAHHDFEVLPNGHLLISAWLRHTFEEAVAAGRDPEKLEDDELWSDHLVEVAPDGKGGGEIVWRWDWWDHLVQDHDDTKPNYGIVADTPRRLDINATPRSTGDDWIHTNSVAYNAELDQILVSSNFLSEIFIIDHSISTEEAKTSRGDLLWRWGNPANYGQDAPQVLFGQHNAHWIPEGCEGAGNILLFNNGGALGPAVDNPGSAVDEIELPPMIANGVGYELSEAGTFGPEAHTWRFETDGFYGSYISGAQRLPNGNTLVNHGPHGCFFEVKRDGELCWCYLNPVIGTAEDSQELKVVPQGSIMATYDDNDGDDEEDDEAEDEAKDEEEDEQEELSATEAAVRSLRTAIQIEEEAHAQSVEKLNAAISDLEAASAPPEPEEKRLPYCDGTAGSWGNSTFRAERLALDHPALVDRDLAPKGALEG